MVGFNVQVSRCQFNGYMAVAKVVGRTHEVKWSTMFRTRGDAQYRLIGGNDTQQIALCADQHVTATQHTPTGYEYAHHIALTGGGIKTAFLPDIPVQADTRCAAQQSVGQASTLWEYFVEQLHGGLKQKVALRHGQLYCRLTHQQLTIGAHGVALWIDVHDGQVAVVHHVTFA